MKSEHFIFKKQAQQMDQLPDQSVDLVVTSPPYPMIEMWDDMMGLQNHDIRIALEQNKDTLAFELMHRELDLVWTQLKRVVRPGGIVCINIGDATRTVNGEFKLHSNHTRVVQHFLKAGFSNLPNILWRKQTNAPNKFMGSGMLPAGAYVTLEHEHILIFRNGKKRNFDTEAEKKLRQESAFFWEERNTWFSDLWDLKGTAQKMNKPGARERSAAYPIEIPYRLINMYSVKGDTVLDPFSGTGTTTLAAMASGRNSLGYEIDPNLADDALKTMSSETVIAALNTLIRERLLKHLYFVNKRSNESGADSFKYENMHYKFPVITRQETEIVLHFIKKVEQKEGKVITCYFDQVTPDHLKIDILPVSHSSQ